MIGRFHKLVKYMSVIQYCISFHAFRSCISTTMPNGIYGMVKSPNQDATIQRLE